MMHKEVGYHLIEIIIVLAMISIIAALSFPVYSQYIVAARRLEAETTLTKLALALEQYQIEHHSYQQATLEELGFKENIINDHYQLSIRNASHYDFVIAASPLNQQAKQDHLCGELTITASGEHGSTGNGSMSDCWQTA
jgi:type IV pilus assembly protein PilE